MRYEDETLEIKSEVSLSGQAATDRCEIGREGVDWESGVVEFWDE